MKILAAIKEKLKRCEGWCPEEGKFEEALEVHAIIFKCNPTIDPPHLWHSSSSDHHRELDNESSLENGRVFFVVAVVF